MPAIADVTRQVLAEYLQFIKKGHLPATGPSVTSGLCPFGLSYRDKSAHMRSAQFEQEPQTVFSIAPDYVWIYGFGSTWQTDEPYGRGPAVKDFSAYTAAIREVEARCSSRPKER